MKPEWCDEKTWFAAQEIVGYDAGCDCEHCCLVASKIEPVARALLTARQEGRKAGLEEAADMVKAWGQWDESGFPVGKLADAIRKAGEA